MRTPSGAARGLARPGALPAPVVARVVALGVAALVVALVAVTLVVVRGEHGRPGARPHAVPSRTSSTSLETPAQTAAPRAAGGPSGTTGPPAAAVAVVDRLEQALQDRDVSTARALAGPPAARRLLAALVRNTVRLGVVGLVLRPVAEQPAPARLERRYGPGTRVDEVEVSWRYAGVDRRPVRSTVRLVVTSGPAGTTLDATLPAAQGQTPPWLLEPLAARRRGRVLVAAPDAATAGRLAAQVAEAVAVVDRRLRGWQGWLVLEAPASVPVFRAASGLGEASAGTIAAVTTTADGSVLPGSPARVFVNPRVFGPLQRSAQDVVLRHETTHVAVDAAASSAPLWLTEGFAGWVALADSRVAVRVLASQVRALVRLDGPPHRLPAQAEFAATDPDLGAAYESAWLAVRLLARRHGAAALLRFQRLATDESRVAEAFRVTFGTTERAFTRAWRRELVRLAR